MWWDLVDLTGLLAAVTLAGVTVWASWYLITDLRRGTRPVPTVRGDVRRSSIPDRGTLRDR